MKKALLFVLVLAVIPAGVGAQSPVAEFWRARAEEGDALGQVNIGVMYENGRGVPEDDAEAVRWFRLAAEQGNACSQSHLGVKSRNGEGVPQDYTEGVRWYRKVAEQGYALAQYQLGQMYRLGKACPRTTQRRASRFARTGTRPPSIRITSPCRLRLFGSKSPATHGLRGAVNRTLR